MKFLIFMTSVFIVTSATAKEEREDAQLRLDQACQAAREAKLIPLRKQYTKDCIEKENKDPKYCVRFYSTYGDSTYNRNSLFLDLPECVNAFEHKKSYR